MPSRECSAVVNRLLFGRLIVAPSLVVMAVAQAKVPPVPGIGRHITVLSPGSMCFASVDNLRAAEANASTWSDKHTSSSEDELNTFLDAHAITITPGEKAEVLAVRPTYKFGTDYVKPIRLLIESHHDEGGRDWIGAKCWWEFSQNPIVEVPWWR